MRALAIMMSVALSWLTMLGCSRANDKPPSELGRRPTSEGKALSSQTPVPAMPPDSVPEAVWREIHAPQNVIRSAPEWGVPFPRDLVVVAFKEEATQAERQEAIDAIGGWVIGGERVDRGGYYYVRIKSDQTGEPLFRAIAKLKTFRQVDIASPEPPPLNPKSARRR